MIRVDRWEPTSKRCNDCGRLNEPMDLSVRQWQCAGCQTIHDRDINAARNLAAIGAGSAEYTRGDWRGSGSAVAEAVLQVEPRIDAAGWQRMNRRQLA